MSHFTVLVIGNNPEKQLKTYDENTVMPEYNSGSVSDEDKQNMIEYYVTKRNFIYANNFGELYRKYGRDWNGGTWREHTDGTWHEYSTYNPNSKWDWYSLGGRWTGFFKLKKGFLGTIGRPGIMTETPKPGYADQALKKHIDFAGMMRKAGHNAAILYDKAQTILEGLEINKTWTEIAKPLAYNDEARKLYGEQPRVKAWNAAKTEKDFGIFSSCDDFIVSREEYIKKAENSAVSTFAIVKDGKWYEKGEMGWFACVANEKEKSDWNAEFSEILNALPEDTLLSVYDCHI